MGISEMFWIGSAIVLLATFAVSATITRNICNPASRLHVLDHPNERSLHKYPTPRTGGVAIVTGVLSAFVLLALWKGMGDFLPWLILSTTIMAVLSYIDDHRGLSVPVRLLGHWVCAGILVAAGLVLPYFSLPGAVWEWPSWASIVFSLLFVIWMVNLYNFMDGMDGFAGGMAVIGFCAFAVLGWLAGQPLFATLNLVVAGAVGGFLIFNFPPARIFMGDTGSSTLGLIAGAFMFWASRDGIFPLWVGVLIFSPFLVDATATLIRRMLRRDNIWSAHKTHYYQRLVELGWGHKRTTLAEYGLMFFCALSAVVASRRSSTVQVVVILGWIGIYAGLMTWVDWWGRRASRRA